MVFAYSEVMTDLSRRKVIGLLASGFVAFLAAPAAVAAAPTIRAGDVCKKVGRRRTTGGRTFECVQEGGSRVWKRVQASPSTTRSTTPSQPTTSEVKVLDSSALAVGRSQNVVVTSGGKNYAVVVTRTPTGVVAFNRACTHQGTFVTVNSANQLYCISHGSLFNLTTGAVIEGPASRALTQYKATERSGAIYITI
jgi:Rieske Fe-S protein